MNKVLYTIDTSRYEVPTIEEWEVVKETEKQYKLKHPKYCITYTLNKNHMSFWEHNQCARKFYETRNEAVIGLNDWCVSMRAKKEKEIEEAQNFIKQCNETIKELWK